MKQAIGLALVIMSFILAGYETRYFGDNLFPQTIEEVICDIVVLLIFVILEKK